MIEINSAIYLVEVIIAIIAWVLGIVIYIASKRKGLLRYSGITFAIFAIIFIATFILEQPQMRIANNQYIEVGKEYEIIKPITTYHFRDITDRVAVIQNADNTKLGEYEVIFSVDTLIGKYSQKQIINVVDTTNPVIMLEGEESFKQSYSKEYEEPGYNATDNYDGDITDKVKVTKIDINEERYDIKYEVQDTSGNNAETIRRVTIIDDIPPELVLNGNETITIYLNTSYEEKGARAIDEKDGDLTDRISIEGSVDTKKTGKYNIIYKVSDNSGNEATKTRNVNVIEKKVITTNTIKAKDGSSGPKGVIYLTFDDGPSTRTTPTILDILKKKGVKATFFVINYDGAGEKIVKRAYNEGHTIAIHGYSHEYKQIYKSVDAYMENITKLQAKIKATTGYTSTITRFPGGSSNTVSRFNPGIMTTLCKEVVDRGFKYFDWNVSSGDAGGAKSSDDVYNNVISRLSKSKQNVVLMHDIKVITMNALERIIDYGLANGYTFERITEDTPMVTHRPNN